MSADQRVVAEPLGNTEADLSSRAKSTLEAPEFETGEFDGLVSGYERDATGRESAELLRRQMAALVEPDRVGSKAADDGSEDDADDENDDADERRQALLNRAAELLRGGTQVVGKLSGR